MDLHSPCSLAGTGHQGMGLHSPCSQSGAAAPQGLPPKGEQWMSSMMCRQSAGHAPGCSTTALACPSHAPGGRERERDSCCGLGGAYTHSSSSSSSSSSTASFPRGRMALAAGGRQARLAAHDGRRGPPRHGPALPLQSERCREEEKKRIETKRTRALPFQWRRQQKSGKEERRSNKCTNTSADHITLGTNLRKQG